jgi:hypothetical protein
MDIRKKIKPAHCTVGECYCIKCMCPLEIVRHWNTFMDQAVSAADHCHYCNPGYPLPRW